MLITLRIADGNRKTSPTANVVGLLSSLLNNQDLKKIR